MHESVSQDHFRQVMGCFATGVTVVTSRHGQNQRGMTVNSLASLSLSPPLVLFCATPGSGTLRLIEASGFYAVNVLAYDQRGLCARFATASETDRFHDIDWRAGALSGCPLLEGCLAYLECKVRDVVPGGDHQILIGEIIDLKIGRDAPPLLFFGGQYPRLATPGTQ